MRTLRIICSVAALVTALALPARADTWNKLTYLTFSAPVDLPGIGLPAGRYRFELADPETSRRVIRVSSQDGSKVYGLLLSMPNQMLEPAKDPVVMFRETPAGSPPAIKAWFYPGESIGYEFVYPRDQALKIAKVTHESVLASTAASKSASSESESVSALREEKVGCVNENDQVSTVEEKAASTTSTTTAASGAAAAKAPAVTPEKPVATAGQADRVNAQPDRTRADADPSRPRTGASAEPTRSTARNRLPRTASTLPWLAAISMLTLAAGLGLRQLRRTISNR